MPRPLKFDVTCKKSMKHVDFPYFSTLETIGFPFVFTRSYQILQKTGFFSLVVKGILRYKNVLCFFSSKLFISWNHKLNWLTRTWNFMDFFSWDAMPQARGVFLFFLIHRKFPGLRPRKSIKIKKTHICFIFFVFFILLRDSSRLTDFLKMCKIRFSGSRVSKFWKIHDSETGSRPSFLFQGVLFLNHIHREGSTEMENWILVK